MTALIRETIAKRLFPEAWLFAATPEDKEAAMQKADFAIRVVTDALCKPADNGFNERVERLHDEMRALW